MVSAPWQQMLGVLGRWIKEAKAGATPQTKAEFDQLWTSVAGLTHTGLVLVMRTKELVAKQQWGELVEAWNEAFAILQAQATHLQATGGLGSFEILWRHLGRFDQWMNMEQARPRAAQMAHQLEGAADLVIKQLLDLVFHPSQAGNMLFLAKRFEQVEQAFGKILEEVVLPRVMGELFKEEEE